MAATPSVGVSSSDPRMCSPRSNCRSLWNASKYWRTRALCSPRWTWACLLPGVEWSLLAPSAILSFALPRAGSQLGAPSSQGGPQLVRAKRCHVEAGRRISLVQRVIGASAWSSWSWRLAPLSPLTLSLPSPRERRRSMGRSCFFQEVARREEVAGYRRGRTSPGSQDLAQPRTSPWWPEPGIVGMAGKLPRPGLVDRPQRRSGRPARGVHRRGKRPWRPPRNDLSCHDSSAGSARVNQRSARS